MKSITDRELLSFCDLVNLKVEFADILKKTEERSETKENHTIYSLLEVEYKGLEERIELGLIKPIISEELISYKEARKHDAYSKEKEKELNEITEGEEKFYNKVSLEKERGSFYKAEKEEDKIVVTDYIYQSKKDLRKIAPMVMEYFDRYNIAIEKGSGSGIEGEFLKEWEIIETADNYTISKLTYESYYDNLINNFKASEKVVNSSENIRETDDKTLKNLNQIITTNISKCESMKKEFPSRKDVEKQIKTELLIKGVIKIINNDYVDIVGPLIPLDEIKGLRWLNKEMLPGLSSYDVIQSMGGLFDTDLSEKGIFTTALVLNSKAKISLPEYESEFQIKISLIDTGIRTGVFRNKEKKSIVIAISDLESLSELQEDLLEGVIPKEVFAITPLINKIILENPDYNITFTGVNNGGKLANILELIHTSDFKKEENRRCNSKTYFNNFPGSLPSIVDLAGKDLTAIHSTFKYLSNHEIIKEGSKAALSVLIAIFSGSIVAVVPLGLGIFSVLSSIGFNGVNTEKILAYLKLLEVNQIIKEVEHNQVKHYSSNKILGEVILEDFNILKEYRGIQVKLSTFLQLHAYEEMFGYKLIKKSEDGNDLFYAKGHDKVVFDLNKNKAERYREIPRQGTVHTMPKSLESEDNFGVLLIELLKTFKSLQTTYKERDLNSSESQGYYFDSKTKKPEKITELGYSVKEEVDELRKNIAYDFFPFIQEDGFISEDLRENFYKSVVKSSTSGRSKEYTINTLDKDEGKLNDAIDSQFWHSVSHGHKSKELDRIILKRATHFIKDGRVPHKELLLSYFKVEENIRKHYEVEENDRRSAFLTFGILDEMYEYKSEEIGYIYGDDDIQGRATIELLSLYGDPEDLIKVVTTGVSETAILECTQGEIPTPLRVTSQKNVTTNGLLDATEGDNEINVNILPFGTCKLNRDGKGQPLPCIGFISLGSWCGVSKGSSINGMKELICTSTIVCKCGGEISILKAISTEITN